MPADSSRDLRVGPERTGSCRTVDQREATSDCATRAVETETEVDDSVEAPEHSLREQVQGDQGADAVRAREGSGDNRGDRADFRQATGTLGVESLEPTEVDFGPQDLIRRAYEGVR